MLTIGIYKAWCNMIPATCSSWKCRTQTFNSGRWRRWHSR